MIIPSPCWIVEKMVPLGVDDEGATEWAPIKVGPFWSQAEARAYAAECCGDVLENPVVSDFEEVFPAAILAGV